MKVKNLMTEDLITIDKDQVLSDAIKLMRKHKISRLPVLNTNQDNQKELVGIVSERDIADKMGSSKFGDKPFSSVHISSVMVKDIFTVDEDMDLIDVAKLMQDNGIGSAPVKNSDGELTGIVSKADFLTLATGKAFDKVLVKDVMSKNIVSLTEYDRVVHARRLMLDHKVGRLLVINDDELKGILTSKDLIRLFIDVKKNVPDKYQKTQLKEKYIEDIMASKPLYVGVDDTISSLVNLMIETGYNGLPVLNSDNTVAGIITQTDILRLFIEIES